MTLRSRALAALAAAALVLSAAACSSGAPASSSSAAADENPYGLVQPGILRAGTLTDAPPNVYIENGELKYPLKNFRFNESPVIMLNNIDELGKPVRVAGDESSFVMMIPPMKLRDFTFTSLSDAV